MTIKELSQLYHLNREIEMDQQRLADLDDEIRRDEDRLARLEMKATSVSGPNYDGMPKAPSYGGRLGNHRCGTGRPESRYYAQKSPTL